MFKVFNSKKYYPVSFFCVIAVHFLSCTKKDENNSTVKGPCSDFTSPYVSNDGPVQMGGSLRLNASSNESGITYQWTGPKSFSSNLQYPVISNISFDAGGTYYARINNGTCSSNTSPTSVIVNAPCNVADNSGIFGSSSWNFNSLITCGINANGYTILAQSINGDLKINFAPDHTPVLNKVYTVNNPINPVFDSTEVQLTIINSSGNTSTGQSGIVYVSKYSSSLSVVFCSVPFKSITTGATITGDAKISCQ